MYNTASQRQILPFKERHRGRSSDKYFCYPQPKLSVPRCIPQIVCPASIVHIISLVCPNIIACHWFFLGDLIQPKNSKTSN